MYISDGYGPRDPIIINGVVSRSFHYGIDIPMAFGYPMRAARSGVVVFSGSNGSLGQQVVIDDGQYQFLYPHMQIGTIHQLGKINQGDVVGHVGMTGLTTGPHTCLRTFQGSWRSDSAARDPEVVMAAYNAVQSNPADSGQSTPVIKLNKEDDMKVFVVAASSDVLINGTPINGAVFALSDVGVDYISAADWKNGGKTMANFYGGAQAIGDQPFSRACDAVGVTWKDLELTRRTGKFVRAGSAQ